MLQPVQGRGRDKRNKKEMVQGVKIFSSELTTDQSRPHGIETTGLTNIQTGLELQPRIPSRLHKNEKYEPL